MVETEQERLERENREAEERLQKAQEEQAERLRIAQAKNAELAAKRAELEILAHQADLEEQLRLDRELALATRQAEEFELSKQRLLKAQQEIQDRMNKRAPILQGNLTPIPGTSKEVTIIEKDIDITQAGISAEELAAATRLQETLDQNQELNRTHDWTMTPSPFLVDLTKPPPPTPRQTPHKSDQIAINEDPIDLTNIVAVPDKIKKAFKPITFSTVEGKSIRRITEYEVPTLEPYLPRPSYHLPGLSFEQVEFIGTLEKPKVTSEQFLAKEAPQANFHKHTLYGLKKLSERVSLPPKNDQGAYEKENETDPDFDSFEYTMNEIDRIKTQANEELKKMSTRLSFVEERALKTEYKYQTLLQNDERLYKQVDNQKNKINSMLKDTDLLRRENCVLANCLSDTYNEIHEAFETTQGAMRQNFANMNVKIDQVHKQSFDRTNALADHVYNHQMELNQIKKEMATIQKNGLPSSNVIPSITLPPTLAIKPPIDISAKAFMQSGAVFNERTRYHAQSFIDKFERYAKTADLNEIQMCTTFLQCISLPGTESWKEQRQRISSFSELKKEFLEEFWSPLIQKHAKGLFESIKIRATSARILIGEIKMWVETLKTADNPDMKDLINTACQKLPSYLAAKVTPEDKANDTVFFKKLKTLENDTKDPNITRGVIEPDPSLPQHTVIDWPVTPINPEKTTTQPKKAPAQTTSKPSPTNKPPDAKPKAFPVHQVTVEGEQFTSVNTDPSTKSTSPTQQVTVEDADESTDSLN